MVSAGRLGLTLVGLERSQHPGAVHPGMWRRGFLSNRRYLYPGIVDPAVPYISDYSVESRLRHINSATARSLLEDKVVFYEALVARGLAARSPEVYGAVLRGRYRGRSPEAADRLLAMESVVLKPVRGRGGSGVRVMSGEHVLSGTHPVTPDLLVQERVTPAQTWSDINPGSLNTMRVVVVRPPGGEPVLAAAVHRFGTAESGRVDNVSKGGICSRIDLESGQLTSAVALPRAAHRVELDSHPDTGRRISGMSVPDWPSVRALALQLMNGFPEVDHVGWDLCLSDRGPLVLEGNGEAPNLNILQFHGPFLQDQQVRRFYAAHGLLPS